MKKSDMVLLHISHIVTVRQISITLSVKDQDGELFDFKGMPIEFELEIN